MKLVQTEEGFALYKEKTLTGRCAFRQEGDCTCLSLLWIDPAWRRRGVARLLLDRMLCEAAEWRVRTMMLEVRPSNGGARVLYAEYGFKRIATRPAYYPADDGREDAYLLSRRVSRSD